MSEIGELCCRCFLKQKQSGNHPNPCLLRVTVSLSFRSKGVICFGHRLFALGTARTSSGPFWHLKACFRTSVLGRNSSHFRSILFDSPGGKLLVLGKQDG